MEKKTTAQVAKELGITKLKLYQLLGSNPALRPAERIDKIQRYLWSEEEINAFSVYLSITPLRPRSKRAGNARLAMTPSNPTQSNCT